MAGLFAYKCVPVPRTIDTGKAGKDSHSAAIQAYENIINSAAEGGWELYSTDTIISYQKPGCFAGLIGKKEEEVHYKLLIYRKPI
jgi:hypothetical protein